MKSRAALTEQFRKAMRHPMFRELLAIIPEADKQNAAALHVWLTEAAKLDPRGAGREPFIAANDALKQLGELQVVERRYSEIFHDPALRQLAGNRWDELTADPAKAYAAAMDLMSTNPKAYASTSVQRAVSFLAETRHAGHWSDEPEATPAEASAERVDTPELAEALELRHQDWAAYQRPEHQEKLRQLAAGEPPSRQQQSSAQAKFDELLAVGNSDYQRYREPQFQQELAAASAAAAAEKQAAAAAAAPAAPPPSPTPSQPSTGGDPT